MLMPDRQGSGRGDRRCFFKSSIQNIPVDVTADCYNFLLIEKYGLI